MMEENGEDSEVCGCEHYKRKCAFIVNITNCDILIDSA